MMETVISFGHDCSMASFLSVHAKIRKNFNSHAFDNMVTKEIVKLAELLDSDMIDLFSDYSEITIKSSKTKKIICNKYNLLSVHEVPDKLGLNLRESVELVKKKKVPAIQKLKRHLETTSEHLFLMRSNPKHTKLEHTVYFHEIITKLRGGKPFTLFLLQNNQDGTILNTLPNLHYYPIGTLAEYNKKIMSWVYDDQWLLAFRDIYSKITRMPMQML